MKQVPFKIIKRSLSLQLSLLVAVSSAVVLTFFGWYRYDQQAVAMEAELFNNLDVTTQTLAASLVQPIFNYDMLTVEMICKAIMDKLEVVVISIYENEQTNLVTLQKDSRHQIINVSGLQRNPDYLWHKKKIIFKEQTIGLLNVGVTRRYLENSLVSTMKTIVIQIVVLEILLVFPLFALLRYRFIIPLQQLTKISSLIADGDLDQDVVSYGDNEIGRLAKTFFNMKDSIRNTFVKLSREVQDRKQAEDELRHLRNYLTNIIDSMPSVLVGVDATGRVTQWNKTAEQATGVSASKAHGRSLSDVFPEMAPEMPKIIESIRTRETRHDQKKIRSTEEGTLFEDVTIYPLIANGVEGAVIRIDDVSEKVRMEEMMIQSEKMLSVGGLAAGMAHEINNPLAGMMQTANVMANRLGGEPDLPANVRAAEEAGTTMAEVGSFMEARGILRMLTTINNSGQRVADIVNNMLSFARKSDAQTSSQEIPELLDKTLELAATDYDLKKHYDFKQIKIVKSYESDLPKIPCEAAKVQQVLLNIFRNGAHAMQELNESDRHPCFHIRVYYDEQDQMICIEVEDNGPGMEPAVRKRIFEPFFTTKPAGVGTGLGLSVSYFIITENHSGEMAVESQPGVYSRFILRLPDSIT